MILITDCPIILFSKFSKERVEDELNDFMEHKFFPRAGGGIGVTRMIRAMKLSGLIPERATLQSVEKNTQKKTVMQHPAEA